MRYVLARIKQYQRDNAYRDYLSECLRMMSGNTAKFAGGEYMTITFTDYIHPQPIIKEEKTAEEIAMDITTALGLKVVQKGGEK